MNFLSRGSTSFLKEVYQDVIDRRIRNSYCLKKKVEDGAAVRVFNVNVREMTGIAVQP